MSIYESIKNFFESIYFQLGAAAILFMLSLLWILVFIVPGIYILKKKRSFNYTSTGTIMNSICQQSEVKENTYVCNLSVQYDANNRTYTGVNIDEEESTPFKTGQTLPVYYDKNNP